MKKSVGRVVFPQLRSDRSKSFTKLYGIWENNCYIVYEIRA